MNINSLDYLYFCYVISIILFIGTILLETATVIPLQIKEASVKDGLVQLRKQLLIKGFLTIIIAGGCVFSLTSRFFISDPEVNRYIVSTMVVSVAFFLFYKSYVDNRIYNQEYTPGKNVLEEKVAEINKSRRKTG